MSFWHVQRLVARRVESVRMRRKRIILLALLREPYDTLYTLALWWSARGVQEDRVDSRQPEFLKLGFAL
jgi:hypothetical protein